MRDIVVMVFLAGCLIATFRRPWHGVLALAVFSYMNPHAFAWGFARSFPVYYVLFIGFVISFLGAFKDRQAIPRDWRIPTFYILWAYYLITTLDARIPQVAWPKLIEVSKIYLPFIFTLMLIDSREKLLALTATIGTSIGFIAAKGGIWAIGTGFAHRVYGPNGTQFAGNNEFAVATVMAIPLLVLWMRETQRRWVRYGIMMAIPLCVASAISSWSRGGLLTLAATGMLLIWHSRRKYLVVPVALAGAIFLVGQLPEEWFGRMDTIENYEGDGSAMTRLKVWQDGIAYAIANPLTGAGFEGWIGLTKTGWHSAFIEMLAEHGFVAFGLWLSMIVGTMLSLTRLGWIGTLRPDMKWVANYAYMFRASLVAYCVGTAFLGLAYWDILYHIIFMSVLLKQFAYRELAAKTAVPRPARGPFFPAGAAQRPGTTRTSSL